MSHQDNDVERWAAQIRAIHEIAPALAETSPAQDGELTRDQCRSRSKNKVRARTISVKRMTKRELEIGRTLYPDTDYDKPRMRSECVGGERPCPYVSCQHHLYIDVSPNGAIKLNFPDLQPWEIPETCAIDVADRGGVTLDVVGAALNLTRERIRQIEVRAIKRLERADKRVGGALAEYARDERLGVKTKLKLKATAESKTDDDQQDGDDDGDQ